MHNLIKMYTTSWCPDCFRAKRVMQMMGVEFEEVNIEQDEEAVETVVRLNNGFQSVPTIVFPDGDVMAEPGNLELTQKLQSVAI